MKTKLYKIYKLTNLLNGMLYVGYTHRKLIKRIIEHCRNDYYIGNALRDYEIKNFKVKVLHKVRDKYLAQLLERMEIWNNNCQVPNGYNLTPGGDGGEGTIGVKHPELAERNKKGHSEETIEKIREALKGNKNRQGCHHTKESIEKIIEGNLGKRYSEEVNKKKGSPGNQFAKGKNLGKNNCSYRVDVKIKRLKTRVKNLKQKIKLEENQNGFKSDN